MTTDKIVEKAKEFNRDYFDSKINLENVTFKISNRMTRTWGNCEYAYATRKITINISSIIFLEERHWHQTLVHELIHALEFQQYEKSSHGEFFKVWAKTINYKSDGYFTITRCTAADQKVANAVEKKRKERVKKQYILKYGNFITFLRKMNAYDIEDAVRLGLEVYKVKNPITNIQHAKNYEYGRKMRKCYRVDIIEKYNLETIRIA